MRTVPAHIAPGCPWCNADHNPDIPCRYEPESVRFQLKPTAPVNKIIVRTHDAGGQLIAVKQVIREG